MSNDKQFDKELDSILKEFTTDTDGKIDIEAPTRVTRSTTYLDFDEDHGAETEDVGMTRVIEEDEGEDDVRIFEGTPASAADEQGATRVIEMDEDETEEEDDDEENDRRRGKNSEALGCLKSILYIFVVLSVAAVLALFIYKAAVDVTGIGRSTMSIDVTVEQGATTQDVAELLEAEDIIEEPFIFRVYCRLMKVDATFHPGVHTLSANMGYDGIVEELQVAEVRDTVTVTIAEGATIDTIAEILEDNNVCTTKEFYTALVSISYDDYDFIAELTAEERKDRVYLLEGYLFPDTYDFYVEGAAETVIRTMLDNFARRVDADTRASIKASGRTLSEVLISASIVQMEAGFSEDMPRVMRVIDNRLKNADAFPYLQMDSTEDYLTHLMPSAGGAALDTAYNTYVREGLPVGAICNPGLEAINAALNPSQEADIINCFYFASIVETGETQFFETFSEHEAWCIEHGVGMYG